MGGIECEAPALARVFAIVLALLGKLYANKWRSLVSVRPTERCRKALNIASVLRISLTSMRKWTPSWENSISYDEAYEELKRLQDEHDEEAAQHRTDLATHTATMGGYTWAWT